MPIKSSGGEAFASWLQDKVDAMTMAVVGALEYAGGQALNEMRRNHKYVTQTGNLQSSTGWVIAMDNQIIKSSQFTAEEGGTEGAEKGYAFAASLAKNVGGDRIALILVAGMEYAIYVEAKGLNVMDSAIAVARNAKEEILKGIGVIK